MDTICYHPLLIRNQLPTYAAAYTKYSSLHRGKQSCLLVAFFGAEALLPTAATALRIVQAIFNQVIEILLDVSLAPSVTPSENLMP